MPPAFLSFVDVACEEDTESFSGLSIVLSSNNMPKREIFIRDLYVEDRYD